MARPRGSKNKKAGISYELGYYSHLHVLIPPELKADWKAYLLINGLTQVDVINKYIKYLLAGGEPHVW